MSRLLSVLLIAPWLAGWTGAAQAAEVGRLRYVAAIYSDEKGEGMRRPEGVACTERSTLVVGDTGRGRLLRYTVEDTTVKAVDQIQASQLSAPIRVQVNSKDEVFALDGKQRRILHFDAKGAYKDYVSPEGLPEPAGMVPRSFRIDRGDLIYVLDIFSARVLVLDPSGRYQRHIAFPPRYGFFSDLAVDSRGAIYLLDSVEAVVYAAQKDAREFLPVSKSLHQHLSFPTSLDIDARGVLYIVDQSGGGIVLLGKDGSVLGRQLAMGWSEGLVYYPSQICLTDKGQLFVADRGNSRVQVFSIVR